mmetsp:Transcript_35688/g.82954  ORF Transcript_35688/g.82954 Transcript_35688/m.82954 type:complete len:295 (-) Transcript_35688:138-1022(-)
MTPHNAFLHTLTRLVLWALSGPSVAVRTALLGLGASGKQHITACNAYADARPARLELWPRHVPERTDEALWTRELAYGTCEEYHVDLVRRKLLFAAPVQGSGLCELRPPERGKDAKHGAGSGRLAAALAQPEVASPHCAVHAVGLPRRHPASSTNRTHSPSILEPAELSIIDAFSKAAWNIGAYPDAEADNVSRSLRLQPDEAVVRLEDKVEPETIATEVLGSRTLGLGHAYAVEPKDFHVVLEDVRGSHSFDWLDMAFEPAHTYVAVRMGRAGDVAYPQKLLLYRCKDEPEGG